MREIKFRGKSVFDGSCVYGLLRRREGLDHDLIEEFNGAGHDVDPKTVGEFTGLLDKNGIEIYEGDIVRVFYPEVKIRGEVLEEKQTYTGEVVFQDGSFEIVDKKAEYQFIKQVGDTEDSTQKVIGNVFENKDLLK